MCSKLLYCSWLSSVHLSSKFLVDTTRTFPAKKSLETKTKVLEPRLVVGCPENAQLLSLVQMAQAAKQGLRLPATKSLAKQQDATWSLTHSG
jgi:hypothetical protein